MKYLEPFAFNARGFFLWGPRKIIVRPKGDKRILHNFFDFLLFLCLFQKKVVSLQRFYYMATLPIIDGIDV